MGSEFDRDSAAWGWQGPTEYPTSQLPPTTGHPTQVLTPPPPYGRLSPDEPEPKSAFSDFVRRNASAITIVVVAAIIVLILFVTAVAGTVMAVSAVKEAQTQQQQRALTPTVPDRTTPSIPTDPFDLWSDPDSQSPWDQLIPGNPQNPQNPTFPFDPFGGQTPGIPSDPFGGDGNLSQDDLNELLRQFQRSIPEELRESPEWRQFFGNP